ncbi:hypothetical protein [Alkaliphilus crotonatoxidans]
MLNTTSLKADLKMIVRDPILILFFILPLIVAITFKLLTVFLTPILNVSFGLDLTQYYGYILALSILVTPLMLGTVSGFLMIDERDSKIQELIKITPIGYRGYLLNRLLLPFIASLVYPLAAYSILGIYKMELLRLLLICILTGLQGIIIAYLLYTLAADKVQGLTYSKGFGIFNILALADIFEVKWLSMIAAITPFYWVTRLIVSFSTQSIVMALLIHLVCLWGITRLDSPV